MFLPSTFCCRSGKLKRFWRDSRGATATEYALLVALLCMAVAASYTLAAGSINAQFTRLSTTVFSR